MKTQAFSLHSLPWLSNFETNQGYKDRQDPSLTLIFPINSDEAKFKDFGHLVWTTTPWTLYSNFCIVVGPDYEPLSRISDAFVTPDQLSRHYKIYPADYVSTEDGTGTVHTAPSFGEEDFQKGAELDLGLFDPLDTEGKFTDKVPMWKGEGSPSLQNRLTAFSATPSAGLNRRPATPRLPRPPAPMSCRT